MCTYTVQGNLEKLKFCMWLENRRNIASRIWSTAFHVYATCRLEINAGYVIFVPTEGRTWLWNHFLMICLLKGGWQGNRSSTHCSSAQVTSMDDLSQANIWSLGPSLGLPDHMAGPRVLDHNPLLSQRHQQGAGEQAEQLAIKLPLSHDRLSLQVVAEAMASQGQPR